MEKLMTNTYYLCTDIEAYNYACKFYKDADTEIMRYISDEEIFSSFDIIFNNLDKTFYFFGSCGKGYLKAEMDKMENIDEDFEVFAIPRPEDIVKETKKPREFRISNPKSCYKVFSRLKKKYAIP